MAGRRALSWVRGIITAALVVVGLCLAFGYSGVYDVAATSPHLAATRWLLDLTRDRSIRARARGITVPPLDDSTLVELGAGHYHEMCVDCHGAPGVDRGDIGQGLYPRPPHLDHAVRDWSDAELYWIVRNGIKLTGMPAFGPTHDERALWGIVAFIRKLPDMKPTDYKRMVEAAGQGHATGEHGDDEHAHETRE
jgi:mono/diheme cytochrome c family protein